MIDFIKSNKYFFSYFLLFIIIGGILLLNIEHGDAIFYFNNHRSSRLNLFFWIFTKFGEEPMYLFFFTVFIFIRYRYAILIPLTGIFSLVFSFALKLYFAQQRPFAYFSENGFFDQLNLIEGVEMLKGNTSFPSGHTLSAFAVLGLAAFLFPKKRFFGVSMFFIALLIAISRIYLVQHFLRDIYLGTILGIGIAILVYWLQSLIPVNEKRWLDRSLLHKRQKG